MITTKITYEKNRNRGATVNLIITTENLELSLFFYCKRESSFLLFKTVSFETG